MAYMQPIYTSAFLLLIIASHGNLCAEGRTLKSIKRHNFTSIGDDVKDMQKHSSSPHPNPEENRGNLHVKPEGSKIISPPIMPTQNVGFVNLAAGYVDTFRPTKPGNSPGGGNSFDNDMPDRIQSEALLGDVPAVRFTVNDNPDGFRPTKPGNSPGAGH